MCEKSGCGLAINNSFGSGLSHVCNQKGSPDRLHFQAHCSLAECGPQWIIELGVLSSPHDIGRKWLICSLLGPLHKAAHKMVAGFNQCEKRRSERNRKVTVFKTLLCKNHPINFIIIYWLKIIGSGCHPRWNVKQGHEYSNQPTPYLQRILFKTHSRCLKLKIERYPVLCFFPIHTYIWQSLSYLRHHRR